MRNKSRSMFMAILVLSSSAPAQQLWKIEPGPEQYAAVSADSSVSHLRAILLAPGAPSDDQPGEFISAAYLLAAGGGARPDFILARVHDVADPGSPGFTWHRFYAYQELRGFFGDSGAIAGMDSVARFADDASLRLDAIRRLADAGRYGYLDELKRDYASPNPVTFSSVLSVLGRYGQDPRFRSEAGDMLERVIRGSPHYSSISTATDALVRFDRARALAILEQRFATSDGNERRQLFALLGRIDPDGQPERTMAAVSQEPDPFLRGTYFPRYDQIAGGRVTRRYLAPSFIRFALNESRTERRVPFDLADFLHDFRPLPPGPDASVASMLDTLSALTDTMQQFNWLGDATFASTLKADLHEARTDLRRGDSVSVAAKAADFQVQINSALAGSGTQAQKFVTQEGWKFLFFNARFVLNALPKRSTPTL